MAAAKPVVNATAYTRTVGDTMHYHAQWSTSVIVEDPRGIMGTSTAVDETYGITMGLRADSATAWFESIDARVTLPGKMVHPMATNSLHPPFFMKLDARGHAQVLSLPTLDD